MTRADMIVTLAWDEVAPLTVPGLTANCEAELKRLTRATKRPTEGLCARVLEAGQIEEQDVRILRAANLHYWWNRNREFVRRED